IFCFQMSTHSFENRYTSLVKYRCVCPPKAGKHTYITRLFEKRYKAIQLSTSLATALLSQT
ncbi:MAG: hypothetical protein ACK5Y3_18025, partial [Pseudanabaena sp.]